MRRILTSHKAVQRLYDAVAYVIIAGLLVFVLGPLMWMGLTSLKREQDVVTADLQAMEAFAERIASGEEVMPVLAAAAVVHAPPVVEFEAVTAEFTAGSRA